MLAIEPYGPSPNDDYLSLFHRYISRSLESLYARIGPDLQELSGETREQAWHLLDYGLKLTHGWEGVRKLILTLAPCMERDGFRHEWLPYLERGVTFSQRVQDRAGEAQLSLHIGRLYRLRGEYDKATAWFERSASLCKEVGDRSGVGKSLNQLAYVARLQSRFAAAEAHVGEALNLLDEGDAERATSHWVLGTVAQAQMRWQEAEHHHRTALQIWQQVGDQQRMAWSLQNVGEALRGAGKYEEAASHFQEAITILGTQRDVVNQAIARLSLGIVYIYSEEPAKALALFQLAEPIFRQVGDLRHLAMVYTDMMIVQRDLGHFEAAMESGTKSIRLSEILSDMTILANAEDELGLTYLVQERPDEAIANFEAGLAHVAATPINPFLEMVKKSLLAHLEEAQQVRGRL